MLSMYVAVDGLRHLILFNVRHPTVRKTLSQSTLENSGQYTRFPMIGLLPHRRGAFDCPSLGS